MLLLKQKGGIIVLTDVWGVVYNCLGTRNEGLLRKEGRTPSSVPVNYPATTYKQLFRLWFMVISNGKGVYSKSYNQWSRKLKDQILEEVRGGHL